MTNCKHMTNERTCGLKSNAYRHRCYGEDKCRHCKPMTNADRIRAMNDEELHDFLCNLAERGSCIFSTVQGCGLSEWLQMQMIFD